MRVLPLDLRFAARTLRRSWTTSALTVVVLAVGIGLTAATFSIVDGILWRPLDFPGSGEVVAIGDRERSFLSLPLADYRFLVERQTTLHALTGTVNEYSVVTPERGASRSYVGAYVTAGFFDVLRVEPLLGRRLDAADEAPGAPRVALLSHRAWQRDLGGDPEVLGSSLLVNGGPVTVVGVLPRGVHFPYRHDLWLSFPQDVGDRLHWSVVVAGRLGDGVSLARSRTELVHLAAQRDATDPLPEGRRRRWTAGPYMASIIEESYRQSLHLMMAAALGVLLIACLNVASLRLAATRERTGELGIRRALGAGRTRLVALLLGETTLLVGAGVAGGLLVAQAIVALYRSFVLPSIAMRAYWIDAQLDLRVLGVAVAAATAAAIGGGLLPALGAVLGGDRAELLAGAGRGGGSSTRGGLRARRALVVAEVALAAALLIGSGLMIESVWRLQDVDAGMETSRVLSGLIETAHVGRSYDGEWREDQARGFRDRFLADLRERPEVEAAALGTGIPGFWRGRSVTFAASRGERGAEEPPAAYFGYVDSAYFATLGTPILLGRGFSEADGTSPVVVINRSLAEKRFPGRNPVGSPLALHNGEAWIEATIVGVCANALTSGLDRGREVIYAPLSRLPPNSRSGLFVVVRSRTDPLGLVDLLREEVARADRRASVHEIAPLDIVVDRRTWPQRTLRTLLALFAAVALFLAAAGLYAVMASSVKGRMHELGVRSALGARARDLRHLVLGDGLRQVGLGLLLGLTLATLLSRFLAAFLFGVERWDATVLVAVVGTIALAGLLAVRGPAVRAGRTDPATVLRGE